MEIRLTSLKTLPTNDFELTVIMCRCRVAKSFLVFIMQSNFQILQGKFRNNARFESHEMTIADRGS